MQDESPPNELASTPKRGEDFRVEKGERVPLTPDVDMTFLGNTHKISEEAVESPLGIGLAVHRAGEEEAREEWLWVYASESRVFTVDGIGVELVEYEYDRWMQLRVK
ncbi:MAG: hypothetical protein K0V04_23980 [Deltaproteobacteria bacterium]|nr:hypothetical protein [Deltaproteobacteria bacterium]